MTNLNTPPGKTPAEAKALRPMKIVLGGALGASWGVMVALLGPLLYFQLTTPAAVTDGRWVAVLPLAVLAGAVVGALAGALWVYLFSKSAPVK